MMNLVHLSSPLLYAAFVHRIKGYKKLKTAWFTDVRQYYNIFMSVWSAYMLYVISRATFEENKMNSVEDFLCKPYRQYTAIDMFLYSKYVEWFDTLFLVLSGKKISTLQYVHHMSTAIVVYTNRDIPSLFLYMGSNCFVHFVMYWYFAFPRGILRPYRKLITKIQIIQHIACVYTTIHTLFAVDCHKSYGLYVGLSMYIIYFGMFLNFYLKVYWVGRSSWVERHWKPENFKFGLSSSGKDLQSIQRGDCHRPARSYDFKHRIWPFVTSHVQKRFIVEKQRKYVNHIWWRPYQQLQILINCDYLLHVKEGWRGYSLFIITIKNCYY